MKSAGDFDDVAGIVLQAHRDRAFPAAVIETGGRDRVVWRHASGRLDYDPDSPLVSDDTIFDLASLTKVLATTTLAMQLVDRERLSLEDPVARWIPEWRGRDRESVTIRALLTHSSGLTAWLPFYRDYTGRKDFQHAICSLPLEYEPDTQSVYSDLGFILLGFVLEDAGRESFEAQASRALRAIAQAPLLFNPPVALRPRIAPTESDAWRGRRLIGEVHDENCWALGGAAGHAGLFGNAAAIGDFARTVLQALNGSETALAQSETVRTFTTRFQNVPGSRALGWDTMLPTSSCGKNMSARAVGHTGFTGTSLWLDPERDVYVVFLTNRVNPTRDNDAIQRIRPAVHDAVLAAWTS